jgi:hypothetical protein
MPNDTQADLTERAGAVGDVVAANWAANAPDGETWEVNPDLMAMIIQAARNELSRQAAALQSEREAAAAETRKIIRDLVENFGAGGPKANKAFAVATRYLLASPPAPQGGMIASASAC